MYHKGIVLEVNDDYCLVMTDDGTVSRIKVKEGIAEGQKIYFLDDDIYIKENKPSDMIVLPFKYKDSEVKIKKITVQKVISVAAAIIICLGTMGIFSYDNRAFATVSMDGRESLQFEINRKGEIVRIISYGDLLNEKDINAYEGMCIEDLWKVFLQKDRADLHIIGYIALDDSRNSERDIASELKEATRGSHIIYLKGENADIASAKEENISIGRYMLTQFPEKDEFEDFLEHTSKESLIHYIENNKSKITKEKADRLIQSKDRYDEENKKYSEEKKKYNEEKKKHNKKDYDKYDDDDDDKDDNDIDDDDIDDDDDMDDDDMDDDDDD